MRSRTRLRLDSKTEEKERGDMQVIYREQPDKDLRHFIHDAVLERDALTFEPSVNVPTLELEIDEISANAALCRELALRRDRRDAALDPRYMVDADGDIVEKQGWEEWIDPEDGSERPALAPAVYVKVSVTVDAVKERLTELREKPTLTTAEKDEALGLVIERQSRSATDARES
jgi:hypothetical protein